MIYDLQETVHDNNTPEKNDRETYVLTHNPSFIYLVLIFSDINEAQFFKMPYRNSPHHKIELFMSFITWIFLNQMSTKKLIILKNQTIKNLYSKFKIKNVFTWEKK